MALTDRAIRGFKAREREYSKSDSGPGGRRGLYIIVMPNGRKVFRARVMVDGTTRYKDLGDYPTPLSLADARLEFDNYRRERRRRSNAGSEEARRATVKDLVDEWESAYLKRYRRRPEQATRALRKDVVPEIGGMLVADVQRRDLVLILDKVLERGASPRNKRARTDGQRMAEALRSLLMQMFAFAVERVLIDDSPARLLPKPRRGRHGESRTRVLTDEEIRRFWYAMAPEDKEALPAQYSDLRLGRVQPYTKRCLRLLLLTALRRSEAALGRWSEIDWKARLWTIPGERTKNGRDHEVPLSDFALEILSAQQELTDGYNWIFASPRKDFKQPMLPSAISQAINDSYSRLQIPYFTPHDLRRTVRSRLSSLRVDHVVSRKVLNHSLEGMDKVYDRHSYLNEKRTALQRWADALRSILAGGVSEDALPVRPAIASLDE